MNSKAMICSQLHSLGIMVQQMDGEELYIHILDACSALIEMVSSQLPGTSIDCDLKEDLISGINSICRNVEKIAVEIDGAEDFKAGSAHVQQLEIMIREQKELEEKERAAKEVLPGIIAQNEALRSGVEELEKEYKEQETLNTLLKNSLKDYSHERIEALKEENKNLANKYAESVKKYDELINQKAENEKRIAEIKDKISEMPDEKQLVADYDKIHSEYLRLVRANEECSKDKQNELLGEITRIESEVNTLTEEMNKIKLRKEEIDSAKSRIITEKGVFETEFIEKLENSMDDLMNSMRIHREKLLEIQENAKKLKKHIEECAEIHKNYSFMFKTFEKPLETIAISSKLEYKALTECYDISKSEHIEQLITNLKNNLDELGRIINECREATSRDQKVIKNNAYGTGN